MAYPKGRKRCQTYYPKLVVHHADPGYSENSIGSPATDEVVAVKCRNMAVPGGEHCTKHYDPSSA